MEWLDRLKLALDYVEDNLSGDIDVRRAAQLACTSPWQFSRMFGYMCGVPLWEYVRRRRLTLAALELAGGKAKVVDVALKYGYDSPTAFNRAFRALHGIAPSGARRPGVRLVAFPRISFQISIKGEAEMVYRLEEIPAFSIVGKSQHVTTVGEENFKTIPKMWDALTQEECDRLLALNDTAPKGLLGVCANMDMEANAFDYLIAVASTRPAPEGCKKVDAPAATYAVFESVGPLPESLQNITKRVYSEWLPTSGYRHAGGPEMEVYSGEDTSAADYRCELWIPVVKE